MPVHRRLLKGGRHILGHIGGALKQPRPRYEPWQNQMVDPSHGGGQFGASGGVGGGAALLGLPGIGLSRLPIRGIPSVFKKELSPQKLLRQLRRRKQLDRIEPRMYPPVRPNPSYIPHHMRHILRPQYGGRRGSRFRQEYRPAGTSLGDLEREYLRTVR